MATAYFYTLTKRRNSTLQPTGGTSLDVNLKSGTSLVSPTFLLNLSSRPTYNYVSFEGRYYFIVDIVSVKNDLWEIQCDVDVLATYKADILASTQYVSYSSSVTSAWLADTRIPIQKNATVARSATTLNFLFTTGGFYVLSAIGDGDGCRTWVTDITNIKKMINNISQWKDTVGNTIKAALPFTTPQTDMQAYQNLTEAIIGTGVVGNAYTDAPNCIRSCIWVPFFISFFTEGAGDTIKLGAFDTGASAYACKTSPVSRTASVNIPWQFSDWRRTVCEEVYLYLPLVGMVSIPSDEIVNESALNIEWSATATDGCIAYRVTAGNQVVGTYGANCSVNYPIGISQQASAGEIVQTAFEGAQRTVTSGLHAVHPLSGAASKADAVFTAIDSVYDTIDTALTRHNTCIGGIGGGAGTGLSLDAECFTVAHPTVIQPSAMIPTMGAPTMKPLQLSTLSGYCECTNAHVACDATATELDMIDSFINRGFYIE